MIIDAHTTLYEHHLHPLLAAGVQQAQQTGRPVLVSRTARVPPFDPLAFFAHGAALSGTRVFWACPQAAYESAGVDAAWTIETSGPQRFADAAAAWRDLCAAALVDGRPDLPGIGPILVGGFAFDPSRPATRMWESYPGGMLALPRYMLTRAADQVWLTINSVVWPDSTLAEEMRAALRVHDLFGAETTPPHPAERARLDEEVPPPAEWKAGVRQLEQDLRHGAVQKVVLARQCLVSGPRPFDPSHVLRQLRADYPDCFIFAVAQADSCFLGASPERLARLRHGTVHAACLAGSIRRGATPEEDRQLGEALLASAKEQAEHAFVVRAICDTLAEVCTTCGPAGAQTLMKLRNVQHLYTPITGRVANGQSILELVARLHPTPAVGGYPREAALRMIGELEGIDRGWYAGPVGWIDMHGDGEFAVAIRSALLRGAQATLFAGCGIVAGSDPEHELAESRLKLRPMLSVLGASE